MKSEDCKIILNRIDKLEKALLSAYVLGNCETVHIVGPRTNGGKDQVLDVVKLLAEDDTLSLYKACLIAFESTPRLDGYVSAKGLELWCRRNWSTVMLWRLAQAHGLLVR